ncbi:MAG: prepilin-type N-terminal cleavage/methylation domain-containing protein [Myxococcales bacterium]|nr:prepilin-type N-terminal cleavage/methylation domain-containing protein [Myxococcales bacterium]MCB9707366.1 prepilin-type N-terminal cleavage/methylation domain-containing protein [Myxococcales bacterium]
MTTKRANGFSLLELMVALTLSATVISSVYFISSSSAKHFQEQQRIAQTQLSLRIAMEQLRRDISRAGFLGTPSSATETTCVAPGVGVQAVAFTNNTDIAQIPQGAAHGVQADRLILVGNYLTSDSYLSAGIAVAGDQIFFQSDWQGFRRSFHLTSAGNPFSAALFDDAFRDDRVLHIETLQGNHFFVTITGRNAASRSVSFSPNITVGSLCLGGFGIGATIAPLARIQYFVGNIGGNLNPITAAAATATGSQSVQLVRRELDFSGAAIANSERAVLEYVVDFNVDFVVDNAPPGAAPLLARLSDAAAEAALALTPERVRSAIVRLSTRTIHQDARFPWVTRAAGAPLTRYRANPSAPGASRVRTIETEIFLPNLMGS